MIRFDDIEAQEARGYPTAGFPLIRKSTNLFDYFF
jgi:hypothetical protein